MRLALIFPPACDPTAPYPALAALAGFLRPQGIDVLPIDANLEGFLALLQRELAQGGRFLWLDSVLDWRYDQNQPELLKQLAALKQRLARQTWQEIVVRVYADYPHCTIELMPRSRRTVIKQQPE